jgi:hypothetical protein
MSIAGDSLTGRPLADQKRVNGSTTTPMPRILIARPDIKLIPEPR